MVPREKKKKKQRGQGIVIESLLLYHNLLCKCQFHLIVLFIRQILTRKCKSPFIWVGLITSFWATDGSIVGHFHGPGPLPSLRLPLEPEKYEEKEKKKLKKMIFSYFVSA